MTVYIESPMCTFSIVNGKVDFKIRLHFDNRLIKLDFSHDFEMFIKKSSMEPFDKAVALRSADFCCPVLNLLKLKK